MRSLQFGTLYATDICREFYRSGIRGNPDKLGLIHMAATQADRRLYPTEMEAAPTPHIFILDEKKVAVVTGREANLLEVLFQFLEVLRARCPHFTTAFDRHTACGRSKKDIIGSCLVELLNLKPSSELKLQRQIRKYQAP